MIREMLRHNLTKTDNDKDKDKDKDNEHYNDKDKYMREHIFQYFIDQCGHTIIVKTKEIICMSG